ncbi:hypothetical protein N7468_000582 [Penicillium chermesinum]|uniref:histidine kinase n=1 Tax=Penicillium chermesinum TaxID=63820 RepID=A0A9W9PKK4_9EURO|nr:uncharacterized protein N7468_000582 [Penicillium chermesinum]KAJ5249131.1 hypothetical protein N7468_000582 [Penicillium chermesinum]
MQPSTTSKAREAGPRKYAYNIDAAREREMHLYAKFRCAAVLPLTNGAKIDNSFQISPILGILAVRKVCATVDEHSYPYSIGQVNMWSPSPLAVFGFEVLRAARAPIPYGVEYNSFPGKKSPMCDLAMKSFTGEDKDIFMVPDLTKDERFNSQPFVTGAPYHRFYVSVPITTPDSYIIGSIAVLDDKPRDGLTKEETQLLQDLSLTVMDYFISQRAMREEHREEKMVRALGLFFRGKTDISEGMDSKVNPDEDAMDHVNKKLEEIQVSSDEDEQAIEGQEKATPSSPQSPEDTKHSPEDTTKAERQQPVEESRSSKRLSPVRRFTDKDAQPDGPLSEEEQNELRPTISPTTERLENSFAPRRVQSVLNRASSLMNQALDVEGVMFVDASVYTRRQMIGSDSQEKPEQNTSLDNQRTGPKSLVLGHSTSKMSIKDKNQRGNHYVPLPGDFITHLIDRYPRGKIFHIEKDGSVALSHEGLADEVSQSYKQSDTTAKPGSPQEKDLKRETEEIKFFHKVLPDARCIAIYPVWDFQRSRWFTVSLVWTNDPGRVLSEPKDLTYMAAFSNSVMAEVSRMDVEAADRAKSDFISSISHELRSPLHGVLGTVELLQETVTGRLEDGSWTIERGFGSEGQCARHGPTENLSALVQEVVEGLLAGAEFYSRETDSVGEAQKQKSRSNLLQKGGDEGNIMTIVDIEYDENWDYRIYAGAWRRVVMNLFGNAIKYTRGGFIRLFMRKDTLVVGGKETRAVHITISDSGRGMSQDFLLHHLYIPFLQEDTQSPGLGVGLHLVHQVVNSLQGKIEFKSEVGRGTDVEVILPVPEQTSSPVSDSSPSRLKDQLKGKTVSFFTESSKHGALGIKPEVFDEIRYSLGRMARDWFGLEVLSPEELKDRPADFMIVTEHEYRKMARDSADSDVRSFIESKRGYPLIVLSGQASSWKVVKENNGDRAIFLSQPVSPKTLATVFENCLNPQEIDQDVSQGLTARTGSGSREATPEQSILQSDTTSNDAGKFSEESSKQVLLVEDNAINLKIIETCVKNTGLPYKKATNGLEALELFKNERFGAVIMDISMPVMDGLSATREMRHLEKCKNLKPAAIVILTAVISAEKQREAVISGVDQFLTKPTPLKRLTQLLRELPQLND